MLKTFGKIVVGSRTIISQDLYEEKLRLFVLSIWATKLLVYKKYEVINFQLKTNNGVLIQ